MLLGSPSEFGIEDRPSILPVDDTLNIEGTAKVGGVVIPDAQLLFSGDFKRTGLDLVLSHDDRHFLVRDYFKGESRATLFAPDGSSLSGQIVNSLTGHVDVAQAGANASAATIIGTVVKLTGDATAMRNGVVVTLNMGDKVYKGDVVQSGSDSALGISFIDGTAFSLGANARMVLNDMVYDPNGSSNSSLLSLVQGTISFVAGETAKHGNMKIDTPVATMGIRGTAIVFEGNANNGSVKLSVVLEPGNHSGAAVLLDKITGLQIGTIDKPGTYTLLSSTGINQPLSITEVQKNANDLLNEREVIKVAFSIAFPQFNFDDANPKTKFAFGTSGNNLAGDSGLPHPWGGEYADLNLAGGGSLAGLKYGSEFPEGPLFINHVVPSSTSGVLVEDAVAQNQLLTTSGTLVFQDLDPNDIKTTTFALAHSTVNAALPGFTNDVSQIGTFAPSGASGVTTGINTTSTAVDWNFSVIDSNPVLQSLALGQTLTEVYTVTVTKNDGSQLTQEVTVTLIGVNDVPTFVSSTNDGLTGIEDSKEDKLSASGTITFRDVDLIDTHSATFVLKSSTSSPHLPGYTDNVSQIGSFALTSGPTGVSEITTDIDNTATVGWSFTLNNNDPVLQSLALGETLTQVYTVIITDNNGAQVTHDITVTLVGTNDAPIITAQDLIGSVTEQVAPGGNLTDSGLITFTDVDLTDVHVISPTITASAGALGTLTASVTSDTTGTGLGGVITWNYTVADSAVEYLAKDQTKVESFAITLSDQNGGVITRHIDVTIIGTNDAPVVAATDVTGAVTEQGTPAGYLTDTGTIAFTDVDLTDVHLVSPTGTPVGSVLGSLTAVKSYDTTGTGTGGQLTWTYTVADLAVEYLAAGQTKVESFTITLTDQNGGLITRQIDVTITGTDDGPVAVADSASGTENQTLTIDVLANDTDVDDGHVLTLVSATAPANQGSVSVVNNKLVFNPGTDFDHLAAGATATVTLNYSIKDDQGAVSSSTVTVTITGTNDSPVAVADVAAGTENQTLTIDVLANDTDVDDGHVFTLVSATAPASQGSVSVVNNKLVFNPGTNFDHLAAGATATVTLNYSMKDDQGAVSSSTVTVTITGTNDSPVAVADVAAGTENQTLTIDVLANDTDVDDGHVFTLVSATAPASQGSVSVVNNKLVFNPGTDFDHLAAGATATVTLNYSMKDDQGAVSSSTVTVTITGTNDGPVAVADVAAGTENQTLTIDVLANDTDVDDGPVFTLVSATAPASQGSVSVVNNKLVFNPGTDFDHLAAGATATVTLNYSMKDDQGAVSSSTVTVTITGTNDSPVAVADVAAGTENQTLTIDVLANDTDVDDGHVFTLVSATAPASQGSVSVVNNKLVFNPGTNFDHLAAGATATVTLNYSMKDDQGAVSSSTVTVTITGTNDSPVAVADVAAGTENQTLTIDVLANDTDVDDGHVFTLVSATAPASQGSVSVVNNKLVFNPGTDFDHLAAGATATVTLNYSMKDDQGAVSSSTVTVTITGTNDVPVISGVSTGAVAEDATLTTGGKLNITDVDSGESHFLPVASESLTGTYGTFTFDPNTGVWGYTLNNAAAETLPTGQVAHDTLTVTSADGTVSQLINVTITSTNDAPIVQDGVHSRDNNLAAAGGQLVFSGGFFFGDRNFTVIDPDGPQFGIAVTSLDNAHGLWEYQLAGTTTWTTITLSSGQALLLSADDKIRFTGDASDPIETLGFKAWDGSYGSHGTVITLPSELGGSSAFSNGTYFVAAKNNGPAGIAGEPINLGLADPSLGLDYTATVTISDIPSDWIVNGGVHNLDGSWTVQTTNLASLSVMTPVSYSGAYLLNVTAAVVLADGSIKTLILGDNVEAYSPGSPILAWSGDDFLTASSGDDLIVFAQPIGHDVVYSFDVAHDRIDLIGYGGFATFADVQAHLTDDANGNAMITLSDGQSIVLDGIHAAALAETNFVFDQTPTLDNTGTMTISDGAFLPLTGTMNNTGIIALNSTGDETDLQLAQYGLTLEGGGKIVLSDSDLNVISGTSSSVTLDNEDNTISGAGALGNGELSLTNAGTINATGTHALVIDTGSNVVVNSGTLEASGSGGLMVLSAVENSGFLWANGANLTVQGAVTGTGTATIDGTGTLDFEASSTANVVFGSGTGGTLKLGDAFHFNGTITGFNGADLIDLENFDSAAASINYQENTAGTGGTLMISDGVHVAKLSLVGDYSADNFSLAPDQLKGTSITYVHHDLVA